MLSYFWLILKRYWRYANVKYVWTFKIDWYVQKNGTVSVPWILLTAGGDIHALKACRWYKFTFVKSSKEVLETRSCRSREIVLGGSFSNPALLLKTFNAFVTINSLAETFCVWFRNLLTVWSSWTVLLRVHLCHDHAAIKECCRT